MGDQWVWEKQDIGVDIIDREHKKLFRILNRLFDFEQKEVKSRWICRETVKYFKDHALSHFMDEEEYMESAEYAGLEIHRHIHKNFREMLLPALEKKLDLTDYSEDTVDHFLGICAGWLIRHTMIEDMAIVNEKIFKQWKNLLPQAEQKIMIQTIAEQLQIIIHLEPEIISECYGGENFGDSIYYRIIYKTGNEKEQIDQIEWEFLLIFEETMIASTIADLIELKPEKINIMLLDAAKKAALQLTESIIKQCPFMTDSVIKEAELLNYNQFRKIYEKSSLQSSLLFDTGKGYFACCATEKNVSSDVVSVEEEYNSAEDTQYLLRHKVKKAPESARKKLLVIDDSKFMLQMMRQLFGSKYDIVTASSGMSAFRSVMLSRPDLILLDYKMQECKGKQILEIIRSCKENADIPVILLISGVDEDHIQNIAKLSPQGYLYKSLSPDLIKKEVDLFFETKF